VLDERLVGEWTAKDRAVIVVADKSTNSFSVSGPASSDPKPLEVYDYNGGPDELPFGPDEVFSARATRVGDAEFLSIPVQERPGEESRWLILQYKFVSDDEVQLFTMDNEKLLKAVKDGQLTGVLKKTNPGPLLRLLGDRPDDFLADIKASRDELRKYLEAHQDECFDPEPRWTLKRKVRAEERESDK
jgi:hypothetical protein